MASILIKNMVCDHCIIAVQKALTDSSIAFEQVELGKAILSDPPSTSKLDALSVTLETLGFELINDKRSQLIEQVKKALIRITAEEIPESFKLTPFLQEQLGMEYSNISKLFSEVEGRSIERYYISLKIERAKELLVYDQLNVNEISDRLGYNSVAHFSAQFKQHTGLPPSHFKSIGKRKALNRV